MTDLLVGVSRWVGIAVLGLTVAASGLLPPPGCAGPAGTGAAVLVTPPVAPSVGPADLAAGWLPVRPPTAPVRQLTVLWSLGGPGTSLQQPVALAVDRAAGRLYVVDADADRLAVVERDSGRLITTWGGPGRQPGRFRFRRPLFAEELGDDLPPVGGGVAIDGQGRVAVADYANHRLQWFDRNGRWLATWGRAGQRPGELDLPWNLAIDARGRVVVSDLGNHRVQVFDQRGRVADAWGGLGMGAGYLVRPGPLTIDACGRVVVADLWGSRVQVFAADGATLGWWALDGLPYAEHGRVTGLATGPDGRLAVTGGDAGLAWHDSTGQVIATGNGLRLGDGERLQPSAVAIDERGDI